VNVLAAAERAKGAGLLVFTIGLGQDVDAALDAAPDARAFFESLPTFYRKDYARWLDSAKRPETRARRIEEFVALLRAGRRER